MGGGGGRGLPERLAGKGDCERLDRRLKLRLRLLL